MWCWAHCTFPGTCSLPAFPITSTTSSSCWQLVCVCVWGGGCETEDTPNVLPQLPGGTQGFLQLLWDIFPNACSALGAWNYLCIGPWPWTSHSSSKGWEERAQDREAAAPHFLLFVPSLKLQAGYQAENTLLLPSQGLLEETQEPGSLGMVGLWMILLVAWFPGFFFFFF